MDDSILTAPERSQGSTPLAHYFEDDDSDGPPITGSSPLSSLSSTGTESITGASMLFEGLLRSAGPLQSMVIPGTAPQELSDSSVTPVSRPQRNSGPKSAKELVFPKANEEIFGFRLDRVLGQGAFARVFLARQGTLAHREVVLKLSAIEGTEPQTLAQLQHTHVVPIYSVHEDEEVGIRAVCMPYFGGACLATVLSALWKSPQAPDSGKAFVTALDGVAGPTPATTVARNPTTGAERQTGTGAERQTGTGAERQTAAQEISRRTYVETCVWTVQRLAEGLQHAHERGVLHRDIKPSNILISADGLPLLLDFNVSQSTDCQQENATLGGTLSYMAPEQLRAVISRNAAEILRVDARADIYGLGLVLYEMLTGKCPFKSSGPAGDLTVVLAQREQGVRSLRETSPLPIPWSLESIARKCLATDPEQRYRSAAELAQDLDCYLQNAPLAFAPELSRLEQIQKWKRRHPRLTIAATMILLAAAVLVPGALLLQGARFDLAHANEQLVLKEANERVRKFRSETQQALSLANTIVPQDSMLRSGIAACERALQSYRVLDDADWQSSPHCEWLAPVDRIGLFEDVRELLLVLAAAQTRVAPQNSAVAEQALELLTIAERIQELPPSRALLLERARYLNLLGRKSEAEQVLASAANVPAVRAHDLYMLATAQARQGTAPAYWEAIGLLDRAIELSPTHYWSYFERALCMQELGETVAATGNLGTCIGLSLDSSYAYFNRGFLYAQQGRKAEAVADYTRAIKYAPDFSSAYFNRGLLYLEMREYEPALSDFEQVRALGRDDALLSAGRAMALEGLGRHDEADRLFTAALDTDAEAAEPSLIRIRWTYGFAVSQRSPHIARRVFDEVLRINPRHPQALYGRGMLAMQSEALPQAVGFFDQAIRAAPDFVEPRRYRAISLARLGELEAAAEDANICLEKEPTNPDSLYAAGCVAALSARKLRSPQLRAQAIEILKQAVVCGAPRDKLVADPDLSALSGEREFQKLVGEFD